MFVLLGFVIVAVGMFAGGAYVAVLALTAVHTRRHDRPTLRPRPYTVAPPKHGVRAVPYRVVTHVPPGTRRAELERSQR